jgi:UDP-N-acetyl-2-amino-2-deoxyglucuronate dehydrogenase
LKEYISPEGVIRGLTGGKNMANFGITGVAGYIAPRHLQAIKETGNSLIAAVDQNDSVGILDRYFFDTRFFREFERFDRHVEKLRKKGESERVHYVSICSPNYLHDAHIRFALRIDADAICEKPLVINPWNIDPLLELQEEYGRKIYTILQLRVHPSLVALREKILLEKKTQKYKVNLTYVTSRGNWYLNSWKGNLEQSGGLATNIGIHFFDLLIWLFGKVKEVEVHISDPRKISGYLELDRAEVKWYLSIDKNDLPFQAVPGGKTTYRSITVDEEEIEFSGGFTDLHTQLYREILAGRGFGAEDARESITLAHAIRNAVPTGITAYSHEILLGKNELVNA